MSEEAKHTPMPWTCHGVRPYRFDGNGRIGVCLDKPYEHWAVEQTVNMSDGGRIITTVAKVIRCGDMGDEELEANALLIAAAPDLVEALVVLVDVARRSGAFVDNAPVFRQVDAALAKAGVKP